MILPTCASSPKGATIEEAPALEGFFHSFLQKHVQRWRATAQATLTDPEIAGRWDDDAGSPGRQGRRLCRRMASSSPGVAKRDVREKSRMCIARRVAPLSAIDDK